MALPILVVVLVAAVWVLAGVEAQLRCAEAARQGARAAARGEDDREVERRARRASGGAAEVIVRHGSDDTVTVRVTRRVRPPRPLDRLPAVEVAAEASAHQEPEGGDP